MLDLPELPVLAPTELTGLRLAPRLPMTQNLLGDTLSMSGGREQEVLEYMAAMKTAFNETKMTNKINEKRAKALDRAMQRIAER